MTPEQMLHNVAHVVAINQSRESIMTSIGTQEVAWLLAMAREALEARKDDSAIRVGESALTRARATSDRLLAEINGVQPGEGMA